MRALAGRAVVEGSLHAAQVCVNRLDQLLALWRQTVKSDLANDAICTRRRKFAICCARRSA